MIYTIKHGIRYTKTSDTYKSNLCIVNKATLLHIAKMYGMKLPKSHTKERMAEALSAYVLSNPEKCLEKLSVKELEVLKDFVKVGADTHVVRPSRKFYGTMRSLLLVSVCHNKKERKLYFLLPDELRELFAPLLEKAINEAKMREVADKAAAKAAKNQTESGDDFEYLVGDDELLDFGFGGEWDEDEGDGFVEEIIDMGHHHYDSIGEFLSHLNDHDYFDSVIAVQDFWHNANVVESKNAVVTLYATVVYANQQTGEILYRSTEPMEVRIDTDDLNSVTILGLPNNCVSKFETKAEMMNYAYGVLTIEGKGQDGDSYVVNLI